ncbi:MAG: response regulator transcription factor [Burkholderiales bacterium]|nr:response regulator transcription factor [Opitutaceae bacterium]
MGNTSDSVSLAASASSTAAPRIDIALVDDSELVRLGLRTLLENQPGLSIVGEASSARTARELLTTRHADVVLLDIRLPDSSGLDVCRYLQVHAPDTRVIFLTSSSDGHTVDEAIRAGAHGYLLKEIDAAALIRAIHTVATGGSILDNAITSRVFALVKTPTARPQLEKLSAQEIKVLALIAAGKTNKEAAHALGLAEKTVKNYLSTVFEKLQVASRAHAAAIYAQEMHARTGK